MCNCSREIFEFRDLMNINSSYTKGVGGQVDPSKVFPR